MRNSNVELIKTILIIVVIGCGITASWLIFAPKADPVEKCR